MKTSIIIKKLNDEVVFRMKNYMFICKAAKL